MPVSAEEPPVDAAAEVVQTASGFSVHTQGGDLLRVLTEIGAKAGFTVVDGGHGGRQPLTVALDDAPLDTTLRRLLRGENYILVYRGGARRAEISGDDIEQIILLSPAGSAPPAKAQPASPLAGPHVVSRGTAASAAAHQPGVPGAAPPRRQRIRGPTQPNPPGEDESTEAAAGQPGAPNGPPPGAFGPAGMPMVPGGEPGAVAVAREGSGVPGVDPPEGSAFGPLPPGMMPEGHPDTGDDADLEDEE